MPMEFETDSAGRASKQREMRHADILLVDLFEAALEWKNHNPHDMKAKHRAEDELDRQIERCAPVIAEWRKPRA